MTRDEFVQAQDLAIVEKEARSVAPATCHGGATRIWKP